MKEFIQIKFICLTVVILICVLAKVNTEGHEDPRHLEILEKFKIIAKDIVYVDYQKEDAFLLNWLRGSQFDLEIAKRRLVKSMEWRKKNKMESISNNPVIQKMKRTYKYTVDGVDKEGRPILEYNGGRWDLRKATLTGKGKEMQLYWSYLFDTGVEKTRNLTASTGKNVSQYILLIDIDGFTVRNNACLSCLALLAAITLDFENNYAGFVHAFIMANAPRTFDIVLDFTKSILSPSTRNALVVLPRDPEELKKYFSDKVDHDQLGSRYGGTRDAKRRQ